MTTPDLALEQLERAVSLLVYVSDGLEDRGVKGWHPADVPQVQRELTVHRANLEEARACLLAALEALNEAQGEAPAVIDERVRGLAPVRAALAEEVGRLQDLVAALEDNHPVRGDDLERPGARLREHRWRLVRKLQELGNAAEVSHG